jgi:hypothetical protein
MNTILLDPNSWDMLLDSNGNIAMASNPYAIAQDVASACKLFKGELYYDTSKGIPYFGQILGKSQSNAVSVLQAQAARAAKTVPEVVKAQVTALYFSDQTLSGTVEVIDTTGVAQNVNF